MKSLKLSANKKHAAHAALKNATLDTKKKLEINKLINCWHCVETQENKIVHLLTKCYMQWFLSISKHKWHSKPTQTVDGSTHCTCSPNNTLYTQK